MDIVHMGKFIFNCYFRVKHNDMKKTIYLLLLGVVLGLAACSDKKDKGNDSDHDDMDQLTLVVSADQLA